MISSLPPEEQQNTNLTKFDKLYKNSHGNNHSELTAPHESAAKQLPAFEWS